MLFARGERPDVARLISEVENSTRIMVSHDPATVRTNACAPDDELLPELGSDWLELLVDGLTFDCLGLADGPPIEAPAPRFWFGLSREAPTDEYEAVGLTPGPHLSGAVWSLPVVRTLAFLGSELTRRLPQAKAIMWATSGSLSAPEYFLDVAGSWLSGGPFPLLGLGGVALEGDGGLATDGLLPIYGFELRVLPEEAHDKREATRLLLRLVDALFEAGPDTETIEIGERKFSLDRSHQFANGKVNVLPA